MDVNIAVVSHKDAEFPKIDGYTPFFVGKNGKSLSTKYNGQFDSTGENISSLNKYYSELTAQYWLWKNDESDIKGLVHYRRYFILKNKLLSKEQIKKLLVSNQLIVGRKFKIKHHLTVRQNYEKYHYKSDLDAVEESININFPEYNVAFKEVMDEHSIHAMNMLICDKNVFDDYSRWLFTVLMEAQIDFNEVDNRSAFQKRSVGFLSERLLDVWIKKNQIKYVELENLQTNHPNKKHTLINKRVEVFGMRAQKASDKVKRILTGTQK